MSEQTSYNPLLALRQLKQPLQTRKYQKKNIIAIDPGVICTGVAKLFNSKVISVELHTRKIKELPERLAELRQQLNEYLFITEEREESIVLIEYPQIYTSRIRRGETRENPRHLLDIAAICGVVVAVMSQSYECVFVNPAEWKGQVNGDVMTGRILARLTETEKELVPQSRLAHNGIDAIGLGLWACGRL